MKIVNMNRHRSVDFTIPSKDGKAPTVKSLRPGESENIDISADDPQVKAYVQTGQILTGSEVAKANPPAGKPAVS